MYRIRVAITFLALSVIAAVAGTEFAYAGNKAVMLEITLDKQSYHPGEQVVVLGKIQNTSNVSICLPPVLFHTISLSLFERGARIMPFEHIVFINYGPGAFVNVILEPGESYSFQRILCQKTCHMPSKPGKYRLCAKYRSETKAKGNFWVGEVDSECVALNIAE